MQLTISLVGRAFGMTAVLALSCGSPDSGPPGSGSPESFPPPPEPPPLAWSPCTETELPDTECATLKVPLDYEHPDGDTIEIALSRVAASDTAHRIGVLLMNPGGPGAPGRSMPPNVRDGAANGQTVHSIPNSQALARFDLIGFDPRGVGASKPAIDCGDMRAYRAVDFSPGDDTERQALEQAMRDFVAACDERNGPILEFADSYSVARDMDQTRRALREEKISYMGGSYGTVIGTAYADLFPERVRACVLGAAVAPNLDGPDYLRGHNEAVDPVFEAFAADCDARPECASKFAGGIAAVFDQAVQKLEAAPLVDPTSGELATKSQFTRWIGDQLLLPRAQGPLIEAAISTVAEGKPGLLPAFITGYGNEVTVPLFCADHEFPDPSVVYGELLPELRAAAPRFGHAWLPESLPCAYWSTKPRRHPAPHARGASPILVIGGTLDPATPYEWSVKLAAELETAVLLTQDGVGHGVFSQCVNDAASAYLVDLTLPAPGTVCPTP